LRVDSNWKAARRVGRSLSDYGVAERDFQAILFESLEELLPDDELLLIMQSLQGGEHPDLVALDREGRLWLFEMKAGEGRQENLLQVLRYGQIFGQYDYDRLERLHSAHRPGEPRLAEAHANKFDVQLDLAAFNSRQVFVTLTNGLDDRTRAAINYWNTQGLEVRPWLYLIYDAPGDDFDVELTPFRVERDNPSQDLASSYYLLNTNYGNDPTDDESMLADGKAAAFFDPWKRKIERLNRGDTVFLYRSGVGVVAFGTVAGDLEMHAYQAHPEYEDEDYSRKLAGFTVLARPVPAAELRAIVSGSLSFRQTMVAIASEDGQAIATSLRSRNA
jgi:hypothetical protein